MKDSYLVASMQRVYQKSATTVYLMNYHFVEPEIQEKTVDRESG
jgi:hypothetical protein